MTSINSGSKQNIKSALSAIVYQQLGIPSAITNLHLFTSFVPAFVLYQG
jgi:hypothetical protein